MTGPVYPRVLDRFGISAEIPDARVREKIDRMIFKELVNGIFLEKSRLFFNQGMDTMKQTGCDGAVLGCTEIPLIVDPNDAPLPTLDSSRLLAIAALRKAMEA